MPPSSKTRGYPPGRSPLAGSELPHHRSTPAEIPPSTQARRGDRQGTSGHQDASVTPTSLRPWLPPEAPSSLEWEKELASLRNVFACRQAHRAHSSSPETPWPPGTRCQLCLLSWPSFRSDQSSLILGARTGKCPGLSWPPRWALAPALTRGRGGGGLVLQAERRGPSAPRLCSGGPHLQECLPPAPLF